MVRREIIMVGAKRKRNEEEKRGREVKGGGKKVDRESEGQR